MSKTTVSELKTEGISKGQAKQLGSRWMEALHKDMVHVD